MKFIHTLVSKKNTQFLLKESESKVPEIVAEVVDNSVEAFAQETAEDVYSVLKNEKPKNRLRRMWDKTKKVFKKRVLGITESLNSVDNGEEQLKNRSTGEIKSDFLYKTKDVFMFLACFETLCERSDFVLRDPKLLETINRVAGRKVFAKNDYKELSNIEFEAKFYEWVKNTPELGPKKADLWTPEFIANSMTRADEDYESEANLAVVNKEYFVNTVAEAFEGFVSNSSERSALVDKGFILSFLRLALKNKKEADFVLQSLIYGAAIGFISQADLVRMEKDFGEQMPMLNVLANADFLQLKKCSADLNGGKSPIEKDEFLAVNNAQINKMIESIGGDSLKEVPKKELAEKSEEKTEVIEMKPGEELKEPQKEEKPLEQKLAA